MVKDVRFRKRPLVWWRMNWPDEARQLIQAFLDLCMGKEISPAMQRNLGDAAVMGTVAEFPARIKCATLSWHAVQEILMQNDC